MYLYISTGNAAFADGNKREELSRIIEKLAVFVEHVDAEEFTSLSGILRDVNGNKVGEYGGGPTPVDLGTKDFSLTFSTENASFTDNGMGAEAALVLNRVANAIVDGGVPRVRDSNGNTIGTVSEVEGDDSDDSSSLDHPAGS